MSVAVAVSVIFAAGYYFSFADRAIPGDALVAYWPLDASSGNATRDLSSFGDNGVLVNAPAQLTGSSCVVHGCLSFEGTESQYIVVAHSSSPLFMVAGDLTACMWVEPARVADGGIYTLAYSVGQSGGKSQGWVFEIDGSGKLWFEIFANGSASHLEGNTVLAPDVWAYVCGEREGSDLRVFVNAKVDGLTTGAVGGSVADPGAFYVGSTQVPSAFYYGAIDELRVYRLALSDQQLDALLGQHG